ncbi:MAG TPA: neutral zinc metallopeptidase [Pyrinomonadaceae bacterium]|nr:neutral zinc metallopeptidase [Pyrinomonadaceae bacterium]
MRWRGERQSDNVEDRRGMSGGGKIIGGGLGGIVLLVIALLMGADPRQLLEQLPAGDPTSGTQTSRPNNPQEDELVQFVRVVLASTEDYWTGAFRQMGREYRKPKLQLFTGRVESACGVAGAAVGPFYCPGDEKIYLDLSFFDELRTRFRAPGDFAQAYVIAHEVGHHVQNLLGTMDKVDAARGRVSKDTENQLSVRLELQADFLAGLWANHARQKNLLDPDDVDEALGAASAVGDDRLQQESQGYVVPDSFTHGSSEQRIRWFRRGFETGDIRQGDSFNTRDP